MVSRSTTGVAYDTARAAAFIGYKLICQYEGIEVTPAQEPGIPRWTDARWKGYLSNLAPSEFRSRYERRLPESLSGHELLERVEDHVDPFTKVDPEREYQSALRFGTQPNLRVQMIYKLLEASRWSGSDSSLRRIGEILCQSHIVYSECGLGSAGCDELVSRALKAGFFGAKMTGGGGGGVVSILGRSGDQRAIHLVAQEYAAGSGAMPHIFEGSSDGVDAFGVRTLQLPRNWECDSALAAECPSVFSSPAPHDCKSAVGGQGVAVKFLAGLGTLAIALFLRELGNCLPCTRSPRGLCKPDADPRSD